MFLWMAVAWGGCLAPVLRCLAEGMLLDDVAFDAARSAGIVAHRVAERFAERGAAVGPELNAGMLAVARALPPPSGSSTTWAGNVDFSPERSVVPSDDVNALNCAHEVVAR